MKQSFLRSMLPAKLRTRLRSWKGRAQDIYLKCCYPFDADDLLRALLATGIQPDDALLVHSSMVGFGGFQGSVTDINDALLASVPRGTLMMPTLSFRGSAVTHATRAPIFDPSRTPSLVGMVSEIFRRSRDVERSKHPTHSVAGKGRDVQSFLAGHHLAGTPCGRGTPYHRLIEREGKVVLLNTDFSAFTLYHCIEELIESLLPFSPFTIDSYSLRVRDGDAVFTAGPMRLYAPDVSARRTLLPLQHELKRRGDWHEQSVGSIRVVVISARAALNAAETLARSGIYCYSDAPQHQSS